jgi:hypothetical protein
MCVSTFFNISPIYPYILHASGDPHSSLPMPHLAHSMTYVTSVCLRAAMLPIVGFANPHRSLVSSQLDHSQSWRVWFWLARSAVRSAVLGIGDSENRQEMRSKAAAGPQA